MAMAAAAGSGRAGGLAFSFFIGRDREVSSLLHHMPSPSVPGGTWGSSHPSPIGTRCLRSRLRLATYLNVGRVFWGRRSILPPGFRTDWDRRDSLLGSPLGSVVGWSHPAG